MVYLKAARSMDLKSSYYKKKNCNHVRWWPLTKLIVIISQRIHILNHYVKVKVAQLCPTLCDPMDYTVHGILQSRILEWVTFPFSRGSSQSRDSNPGLLHDRQILYQLSHKGSPRILEWVAYPFSRGSSRPRNQTGVPCIAGRMIW